LKQNGYIIVKYCWKRNPKETFFFLIITPYMSHGE